MKQFLKTYSFKFYELLTLIVNLKGVIINICEFRGGKNMRALFFVLNETEKLDDVLTEFTKRNIKGATVLESAGMASLLSNKHDEDEIPFLGSLRNFLNPERQKNNIILTIIRDDQLDEAVEAIEFVVGDLCCKNAGVVFSVPIDFSKGICGVEQ